MKIQVPGGYILVVCDNPSCGDRGYLINLISGCDNEAIEDTMRYWGSGSEDDDDYCPCCGELGLPITGDKLANMIRAVLGEP
jgi:hypothetical protein